MGNGEEAYSWPAYRVFVVKEMARIALVLEKMDDKFDERIINVDERLRKLELKAAQWGAVAGFIGTALFEIGKVILVATFHK